MPSSIAQLGLEAAQYVTSTFIKPINLEFEKVYWPYLLISKVNAPRTRHHAGPSLEPATMQDPHCHNGSLVTPQNPVGTDVFGSSCDT